MFGDGVTRLKGELTRLGLTFDWNPDRPINDERAKSMNHEHLAQLVRTFMTHVKSNSWTAEDLEHRLSTSRTCWSERSATSRPGTSAPITT